MYSSELTEDEVPKWQLATSRQVARTHSMKAINTCLLFCSIFGALVGLCYLVFDPIVKHIVLSKLVLSNSSDFSKLWQSPPITPHLKVYLFNLTNAEGVFNQGIKPNLVEIGPYVYHQKWIKENVQWHRNGTMSYSTRKLYTFIPHLSVGNPLSDLVTTLNVPAISAYYQMRNANPLASWGLETIMYSWNYNPWLTKTVDELVWGYEEPLFELAKMALPNPPTMNEFGFFIDKNNSARLPIYTMFTGENNPYNLSKISLFNGHEYLDFWSEDRCNLVQGSDGATFNPYIQKDDTLWFFSDQLCRSLPLVYDSSVRTAANLPGFRFVPRQDVFKSPKTAPENECFCVDRQLCSMLGDGLFGVSACQFDAPIVLSWPHFLDADPTYLSAISGLQPRRDEHAFHFDIQPITGTTLAAKARIQVNVAIKGNSSNFEALAKIPDTIMPILWFEEGLDELGTDLTDIIAMAVNSPPVYKNYIFFLFLGFLMSILIIGSVAIVRIMMNHHRRWQNLRTMKRVRHTARNIIIKSHPHTLPHNHNIQFSQGDVDDDAIAHQPMLASADSSEESSRSVTTNHSRNTSTGSSSNSFGIGVTANGSTTNASVSITSSPAKKTLL